MTKKTFCFLLLVGIMTAAVAQKNDTTLRAHTISAVTVTDAKPSPDLERLHVVKVIDASEICQLPVSTIADLLEQLPGVDLRTRGDDGVQTDLSMRGGTFDQVLVLLNGVNITDPQTGHHNMDLPIDLAMVERVEMLQGTALDHFGLSAFCGAINIVTGQSDTNYFRAGVLVGSFGRSKSYFGTHRNVGPWALTGALSYSASDGYRSNTDYSYGNLFLQAVRTNAAGDTWALQLGGQLKGFGANAFYSQTYPDQYEATKTLLASAIRTRHWNNFQLEYALFGRLHYDRFELFREGVATPASWYKGHNYHLTDVTGANAKGTYVWRYGKTSAGMELRHEHILSNVLGNRLQNAIDVPFTNTDAKFLYAKDRLNLNYFAEHNIYGERLSASVGISGNTNSMFGNDYCFSGNATYRISSALQAFVNVGRSLRLPTFTDLYYHSATEIANPDLKPEESVTSEVSLHYNRGHWYAQGNVYYRQGHNVIDWIKMPGEAQWHSANHTEVDALGTELDLKYTSKNWLRKVELGYAYCQLNKEADGYLSAYALDYLRHKVSLGMSLGITRRLSFDGLLSWQSREGSYMNSVGELTHYQPVSLMSARLNYEFKYCKFYVEGTNLLNKEYYDYGGVPQPGIMFAAGITFDY